MRGAADRQSNPTNHRAVTTAPLLQLLVRWSVPPPSAIFFISGARCKASTKGCCSTKRRARASTWFRLPDCPNINVNSPRFVCAAAMALHFTGLLLLTVLAAAGGMHTAFAQDGEG